MCLVYVSRVLEQIVRHTAPLLGCVLAFLVVLREGRCRYLRIWVAEILKECV